MPQVLAFAARAHSTIARSRVTAENVISLDVGTTALKAAAVTPTGKLLARVNIEYKHGARVGPAGAVEQHPDDWLQAACEAINAVVTATGNDSARNPRFGAIALTGQMQNLILVHKGRALRPALLYSDVRAQEEAESIEQSLGQKNIKGSLMNYKGAGSCFAKWLWLYNNEPAILSVADRILLGAHSYVAYRLTGRYAADLTTSSTTGLLRFGKSPEWATAEIERACPGLDVKQLPPLLASDKLSAPLDYLTTRGVEELGLPACLIGVPVFHGMGDVASTTIGTIGVEESSAEYIYLGTSGWIAACRQGMPTPGPEGLFELLHPSRGLLLRAASMTTAGGNAEWARRTILGIDSTHSDFDAAAAYAPVGSRGVLFLPHLQGERSPFTDPSARASFLNISSDTGQAELCRAVLEGVALGYRALAETLGLSQDGVLPMVGGGARSHLWTQIMADALGRPVLPLEDADAVAARGCAAEAFAWAGSWPGRRPPREFFSRDTATAVQPRAWATDAYSQHFEVFRRIHPALSDTGLSSLL
uniref:Glycerol kinase n=1 Tax=Tetraselmis sp. GSL018 TaxID=582737 RepID=A0A061QQB8_9CHLO|mmetsp:Transcript_13315/g.31520  ORF Transcript_13315/g.31520 Transcript_13315/m.31520 type:complete len:534 (-) Transcript_13315:135-1736(-)